MKREIFVVILLTLAVYAVDKTQVNELLIDRELNLGQVDITSKKVFEISLVNKTRKSFEIAKIYTSCGCTRVVGKTAFTLKPKNTEYVSFEFDPISMHEKNDSIDHEIYILTARPTEKEYKIKITGKTI